MILSLLASAASAQNGGGPCTLQTACGLFARPFWQSQRDCGPKPRVGAVRLPWVWDGLFPQPQRGCGSDAARRPTGCNPFGVVVHWRPLPRVAPVAQPWALSRNPFGIQIGNRADRILMDRFEADAYEVQGGPPQSKTLRADGTNLLRASVLECASPLALSHRPSPRVKSSEQPRTVAD